MEFFVTAYHDNTDIVTEKLPYVKDDWGVLRVNGNKALPTLELYLEKAGVDDKEIGEAIEKLEAIPFGAGNVTVTGRDGDINIIQRNS